MARLSTLSLASRLALLAGTLLGAGCVSVTQQPAAYTSAAGDFEMAKCAALPARTADGSKGTVTALSDSAILTVRHLVDPNQDSLVIAGKTYQIKCVSAGSDGKLQFTGDWSKFEISPPLEEPIVLKKDFDTPIPPGTIIWLCGDWGGSGEVKLVQALVVPRPIWLWWLPKTALTLYDPAGGAPFGGMSGGPAFMFDETGQPVQIGIYRGTWVWSYNGKRVSSVQAVIRPKKALD